MLHNANATKDTYDQYVDLVLKGRADAKLDQRTCFDYLYYYAVYGPHNMRRGDMSEQELRQADPQQLLGLLGALNGLKHSVLYYGPLSEKELATAITKYHRTPKALADVPQGQPYTKQLTPQNEVWLAPFDAKNIYMRMYHNEGRSFNPDEVATIQLFNEYFGGGMNGIVFQELREARGLAYNAGAIYAPVSKKDEKESFMTHIITQNDKMMDCVRQFHQILDTIPQSEAAFNIAKDAVIKQLASQRTTKFGVISSYINAQRLGLDYDLNAKRYRDVQQLKLSDIVNFEQQQMTHKTYRYAILGDEKELDIPALEKIAPIKRLTLEEVFGY